MRSAEWFVDRFGLTGDASLVGPVDRGFQGQVWQLVCGSGTYAVKETTAPLAPAQVRAAYALQTRAAARGVAAPRQLPTVDGEPAAYVDGETWRVFDWVTLAGPDRGLDPAAVGRLLAALHATGGPADGKVDGWYVDAIGRDRWVELIAELRCAGAPFADDLDAQLDDLLALAATFEPPQDQLMCHRDLWADNVRAGPAGPVVIDWDNCGPASAVGELAMVLVEFGTSAGRARLLYDAYCGAGGPARLVGLGDFTMPGAVLQHLLELGATQWLAAGGDQARQRAEQRVREFTDDPFGVAQAAELLDACQS